MRIAVIGTGVMGETLLAGLLLWGGVPGLPTVMST